MTSVLLVDDDPTVVEVVTRYLDHRGVVVHQEHGRHVTGSSPSGGSKR